MALFVLGLLPVRAEVKEVTPPSDAVLLGHIHDLGAEGFRTRRDAQRTLETLGREHVDAVLKNCLSVYATNTDVEVQQRLDDIMFMLVDKEIFDAPKGFMGIRLSKTILPGEGDAIVHAIEANEIIDNTGAAEAGMQVGDLILSVNDKPVPPDPSTLAFTSYVQSMRPGTIIQLKILRDGKPKNMKMKLGERPREASIYFRFQQSVEEFYDQWLQTELAKIRDPGAPPPAEPPAQP